MWSRKLSENMPKDNCSTVYSNEHGDMRKRQPSRNLPPRALCPEAEDGLHREAKGGSGKAITLSCQKSLVHLTAVRKG